MKPLLERWQRFLEEIHQGIVPIREELVQHITEHPEQVIHLDSPRGSSKAFGRGKKNKVVLPFDYGEYPDIINPADNMGWDIIIVPSATKNEKNLIPVGHIAYSETRPEKIGNDKIIIAPAGKYSSADVKIIEEFFAPLGGFEPVEWY